MLEVNFFPVYNRKLGINHKVQTLSSKLLKTLVLAQLFFLLKP